MPDTLKRKPVVYLIAQPTVSRNKKPIPLDALYDHGEVCVLCPAGLSPSSKPGDVLVLMENRFLPFDPDVDHLVWAGGDTLSAMFAGMLLAQRDIWEFSWLRYERPRTPDGGRTDVGAKYEPVWIDLANWDDEEDVPAPPSLRHANA